MLGGNFIYGLPCLSLDFECDCFAWLYYSRFFFAWEEGGGVNVRPSRGCCLVCGFVGGWILGCRESAKSVFQKSELASCSRSDSGLLKNNADFRQPRISSPPAEAEPDSIPGSGCEVQGGRARVAAREFDLKCEVEWVHGSWMSRQRCAGRRGGKAEFPCGLMGRGWAEALRCRLGVCRGVSLSAGSVSNCGGIFRWVLRDFLSGVWYGWYIL